MSLFQLMVTVAGAYQLSRLVFALVDIIERRPQHGRH